MDSKREEIITSEAANRMLDMVTPIYDNSYRALWMMQVLGAEMDGLNDLIDALKNELAPEHCTWSIGLWERRYGIVPKESDTLEERINAVLRKRSAIRAISPGQLEEYLKTLTGLAVTIIDVIADYTFEVDVENEKGDSDFWNKLRIVVENINRRKQSHMAYALNVKTPTQRIVIKGFYYIEAETE